MTLKTSNRFRQRLRFEYLYKGKSRAEYVAICKRMGINDICECEPHEETSTKRRRDSGVNGILECRECRGIMHPLMYMYACDECTEPTLSTLCYLPENTEFLCEECGGY